MIEYSSDKEWIGIVGKMAHNGGMTIYSVIWDIGPSREIETVPFNKNIIQMIRESKVLVVIDALVNDRKIGGA